VEPVPTREQLDAIIESHKNLIKCAKSGIDIKNACYRGKDKIDFVDFIYGRPGNPPPDFPGGFGIIHAVTKRRYEYANDDNLPAVGKMLQAIPFVIMLGEVEKEQTPEPDEDRRVLLRAKIGDYIYDVALAKKKNADNHYVVSAFNVTHLMGGYSTNL
jgi:hypothetical protein